MANRRPDPAALEQQCTRFNNQFAVGAWVVVRLDNGENVVTRTVHAAEVLSGHSAVIWLEGISGCYWLDRVTGINRVLAK